MPDLLEVSRILLLAPICYLLQHIVFVEVYGDKKPTSCGYVVWKKEEYLLAFFDTDFVCVCGCVHKPFKVATLLKGRFFSKMSPKVQSETLVTLACLLYQNSFVY